MHDAVLLGFAVYYAAVATALNWWLRKRSLWFTSVLAVVLSQAIVFGGDYIYRGHWESWNAVALVMTSLMCIPIVAVVAIVFRRHRARSASVPS